MTTSKEDPGFVNIKVTAGSKDMRQMTANYGPLDLASAPHIAKMNTDCVLFFTSREIKSLNQCNVKEKRGE